MTGIDFVPFKSPRGLALWPVLDKSEVIKGKPTGKKVCGISFTGDALTEATAMIEEFIRDNFPPKIAPKVVRPFKTRKVEGQPDLIFLKFKTNAEKDGHDKVVPLYDARGNLITSNVALGNGSIIRISGSMAKTEFQGTPYVGLFLESIKVLKLVEFRTASPWSGDDDAEYAD